MDILDSHCHLDLVLEQKQELAGLLEACHQNQVNNLLQIATNLRSSLWNRDLAQGSLIPLQENYPRIYWTVGLHPEAVQQSSDLPAILDMASQYRQDEFFWGLGETGLDYYHTTEHIELQKECLIAHLEVARELKLPLVLHTRDDRSYNPDKTGSIDDAFAICKRYPDVQGVLHCFTYTAKEAHPFIDELGWFVSYSGVLTFKNAQAVQSGAVELPLQNLLVETDAPYLAPVPHRGQCNQPAYVRDTFQYLIELRARQNEEDPSQIQNQLEANQKRFLGLKNAI